MGQKLGRRGLTLAILSVLHDGRILERLILRAAFRNPSMEGDCCLLKSDYGSLIMDRFAAAAYAPLVMYAWDMCDRNLRVIPPFVDPRISNRGWVIIGYLSAGDDIVSAGNSIRSTKMGSGDRVSYGYVASRGDEIIVSIRGTDGAEEWADDLDFFMQQHPNPAVSGLVDQGFFSIYSTMEFHSAAGSGVGVPVVEGLMTIVGTNKVLVLGHSLGAAIATYLTLDLNLAGCPASACLFASPRTGNQDFVDTFEARVSNYDLFNYERDLVPTQPRFDILHFSRYAALHQAKTIPVDSGGEVINDNPLCNHHLICYTALLDPNAYKVEITDPMILQDDINCARCVA